MQEEVHARREPWEYPDWVQETDHEVKHFPIVLLAELFCRREYQIRARYETFRELFQILADCECMADRVLLVHKK